MFSLFRSSFFHQFFLEGLTTGDRIFLFVCGLLLDFPFCFLFPLVVIGHGGSSVGRLPGWACGLYIPPLVR